MISGSLAQSLYATPRMTRDIDLVIELSADRLPSFGGLFKTNFYYPEPTVKEELKRQGMFNVIDHRSGFKVDFAILKNEDFRRVEFSRRRRDVGRILLRPRIAGNGQEELTYRPTSAPTRSSISTSIIWFLMRLTTVIV
jgi:hypothetical protein